MTSTSYLGTAAVTIQFDLNRNIDGAANDVQGAHQRRQRPVAEEPALAADLPQGQPGGLADPAAVGDLGHAAAHHRERRGRRPARAADQPDFRRRPGRASAASRSRRSASRSIRPSSSPRACRWRTCARRSRSPPSTARKAISTARRAPTRSTPTTSCPTPTRLERRHHRLSQRRPVARPRHRPGGDRPGGRQAGGLGQRQARRVPGRLQAARRQRHRHRRQDQVAAAAAGGGDPAGRSRSASSATAPQTIRAAVEDVQFTLLLTIVLVVMVIFVFLRSFWATVIPTRHRAARAARRLRADVGVRLYARQSVADGPDDRRRLRGRRRHRDAGEHHPLYRGGRDADGGRPQGRRARSASPSSRSAFRWSRC